MATEFLQDEEELDKEIMFDPERDISEKDWKEMKGRLKWGGWDIYALSRMAMQLYLLFPDRKGELGLADRVFTSMERACRESISDDKVENRNYTIFGHIAMSLYLLFPERKTEIDLVFDDVSDAMIGPAWARGKGWERDSDVCLSFSLLFPNHREEFILDDEAFLGIRRELEKHRGHDWMKFADIAARLVLLFPDRRDALGLDAATWEGMKGELNRLHRAKDWETFTHIAFNLHILAAQDARITSDGQIQITPKKPALSKAPPPLPERARV